MIIYFADRHLNILGQATSHLPKGVRLISDLKSQDVETGVSVFEGDISFDRKTRAKVEKWAEVGNYILKNSDTESELYNIIDAVVDAKKQKVSVYAEDDGLDLLNDIAEAYAADQEYPISSYVERFAGGAGWEIGINEVEGLTRKLSWDSEQTVSARLISIAEAFNHCEFSFSFEIKRLQITKKYINIYEKRGKDTGVQLRLNKDIDSIVTTKSIANLATALRARGSTPNDIPDHTEKPVTLLGYEYDDGDFYVDGAVLKSRKALEKWSRFLWKGDDSQQSGGHIVKSFSYDTTSQAVLCEKTIEELKKVCDMEVNYEVDFKRLPPNIKIGDRVNIIDDAGELYLSTRLLKLETSESDQEHKATLGEHLIKGSGISQKVADLAAQFAANTESVKKALEVANAAKENADAALEEVENATGAVQEAIDAAEEAKNAADSATESANQAAGAANAATEAANKVVESVEGLQQTIDNANQAAQNAANAAQTATEKAEEAEQAAENAQKAAEEAASANSETQKKAAEALEKAEEATETAGTAKAKAQAAAAIANAAKKDAEQAEADIAEWEQNLKTVTDTMSAEYSRKTDLTEATESLQSQISRNAGSIKQNVIGITVIDETANNALTTIEAAQKAATSAQEQADEASAIAAEAQTAANTAQAAAQTAQNEANTAKAAYETAKQVADKAEADLKAAEEDLATVAGRVDATEAEIAASQKAVDDAQAAADTAKANAKTALTTATAAQEVANAAVDTATKAQLNAEKAANEANIAQQLANEAKGNATAAQNKVNEAQAAAKSAKATADTLKEQAEAAQATADQAVLDAATAQVKAENAREQADKAAASLATAQQNLEDVLADVEATEEAVANAYADVAIAQAAATQAQGYYETAQAAADNAQAEATAAQTAADTAKAAADNAQAEAKAAQDEVDKALGIVYSLEKRVTTAETGIEQTKAEIRLFAKKEEVIKTLGDYYTKVDTEAAIAIKADEITNTVSKTHLTKDDFNEEKAEINQSVSEVSQKADAFDIKFTAKITETDNEMHTKFNEIHKYFSFTENGISIGGGSNAMLLTVDNDNGIIFSKNGVPFGWWDGVNFHTGNIVVEVDERAQFGNFAFIPRTDGSLSFLKVDGSSTDAHTHSYIETVVTAATCEEKGVKVRICSGCGTNERQEIPALGHNYVGVITPPTETEQGYTTHTCERCGDKYIDTYTEPTGHIHNYTAFGLVEPTCTEQGYNEYTCECGHSYKDSYTDAKGHSDGNGDGYCDVCGVQTGTFYTITVQSNNTNYGTVSGGGTFLSGNRIGITATPNSGYKFTQWSDGNTNATRLITVSENKTYIAYFEADVVEELTITEGVETSVNIPTQREKVYLKFVPQYSGSYTFESFNLENLDPDCDIYSSDKETVLNYDNAGSKGFNCTYDSFVAGNTYYLAASLWSGTGSLTVKVSYNGSSGGSSGGGSTETHTMMIYAMDSATYGKQGTLTVKCNGVDVTREDLIYTFNEGDAVTLTLTPYSGFKVNGVYDADANEWLAYTNTYTFTVGDSTPNTIECYFATA